MSKDARDIFVQNLAQLFVHARNEIGILPAELRHLIELALLVAEKRIEHVG